MGKEIFFSLSTTTSCDDVPYLEAILIVNGNKVFSKWKQNLYLSLVSMVVIDLLTSTECLDTVLIGSKDNFSLEGKTL